MGANTAVSNIMPQTQLQAAILIANDQTENLLALEKSLRCQIVRV